MTKKDFFDTDLGHITMIVIAIFICFYLYDQTFVEPIRQEISKMPHKICHNDKILEKVNLIPSCYSFGCYEDVYGYDVKGKAKIVCDDGAIIWDKKEIYTGFVLIEGYSSKNGTCIIEDTYEVCEIK